MTISELFLRCLNDGINITIEVDEDKQTIEVSAKKRHGVREFYELVSTTREHIALSKAEASEFIINQLFIRIKKAIIHHQTLPGSTTERTFDDDTYLIPIDKVGEFDNLVKVIESAEENKDNVYWAKVDELNTKFQQYIKL